MPSHKSLAKLKTIMTKSDSLDKDSSCDDDPSNLVTDPFARGLLDRRVKLEGV